MRQGVFHDSGPHDDFRLPVMQYAGTCMILVSLDDRGRDITSWQRISHVASQLVAICSIGDFPRSLTGGWMNVGLKGAIMISIERYRPVHSTSEDMTAIDTVP